MKKIICAFLSICLSFTFFSCDKKEDTNKTDEKYFVFTEETIQKIGNKDDAAFIENYCNEFYEIYQLQCKKNQLLLSDEESLLAEKALKIKNEIMSDATNHLMNSSFDQEALDELRDILAFYSPFCDLGAALAQENLDAKYSGVPLDPNADMSDYLISTLSDSYKQSVEEAFETIKTNYCKK